MHRLVIGWMLVLLPVVLQSRPLQDPPIEHPSLQPQYLLIHVDGISADHLREEWQEGRLPHLKAQFGEAGWIPDAITYLPSKTPMVVSSVRKSTPIQESPLVSWAGADRLTGQPFTGIDTFREMIRSKSRLGMANLLYGIPSLSWLNIVATRNLPDFVSQYPTLEYYWYPIDTIGHFYGEETYLEKIHEFDRHIGSMLEKINPTINVILYSDHGMAFGRGLQTDEQIRERFGEDVRTASYPNIYLSEPDDPAHRGEMARRIVSETDIDFVFYLQSEGRVVGIHDHGEMVIIEAPGGHRYRYGVMGQDPLGFTQAGYQGELWSDEEWLEFSYDLDYPAAPSQIFHLLENSSAGDLVTFLEAGRFNQTDYSAEGNHGGFTRQEASIPIFFRGPDLTMLEGRETIALNNLMKEIGSPDFDRTPRRDRHHLYGSHHLRQDEQRLGLTLSLHYRWQLGGELHLHRDNLDDRYNTWIAGDIFRSYIARVWVGMGLQGEMSGKTSGEFHLIHELRYRRWHFQSHFRTHSGNRYRLIFDVAPAIGIEWINFRELGLRLRI
ncbi:MAG: alkaline phosphatase family protein [Balneolaceae bacterium]